MWIRKRKMSKRKRWAQYILTAVFSLVPWFGWLAFASHYTRGDNAEAFPEWVQWTVFLPAAVVFVVGALVVLLALIFFWIWLIDIPGDFEMAAMEKEREGSNEQT